MTCPRCGSHCLKDKIRQYTRPGPYGPEFSNVVDVGWECEFCHWQFGFQDSPPSYNSDFEAGFGE